MVGRNRPEHEFWRFFDLYHVKTLFLDYKIPDFCKVALKLSD